MTFLVVIPARYASTRLPGKPLVDIAGKSMIQRVYESAISSGATAVYVATDDQRIADVVEGFGGQAVMTSTQHRSGTERVAEVLAGLAAPADQIVVNVQGDEPLMPAELIRQVAEQLDQDSDADMATLAEPIDDARSFQDPNIVKVVADHQGRALYFSRAAIATLGHGETSTGGELVMRHIGIYAYRAAYLQAYVGLPVSGLELAESLEQLRVLYHGGRIRVGRALQSPGPSVDTDADLALVRRLLDAPKTGPVHSGKPVDAPDG